MNKRTNEQTDRQTEGHRYRVTPPLALRSQYNFWPMWIRARQYCLVRWFCGWTAELIVMRVMRAVDRHLGYHGHGCRTTSGVQRGLWSLLYSAEIHHPSQTQTSLLRYQHRHPFLVAHSRCPHGNFLQLTKIVTQHMWSRMMPPPGLQI